MDFAARIAGRYLRSKKTGNVSVGTVLAILGVMLGVAALLAVMSVTGGFREQFQNKVLGVNAHVLVLKHESSFTEYRQVMKAIGSLPGVVGAAPFSISPMMLTYKDSTATGVLVKGVDPLLSLGARSPEGAALPPGRVPVLELPRHVVEGTLDDLRLPTAKPASARSWPTYEELPPPSPPPAKTVTTEELLKKIDDDIREADRKRALPLDAGAPASASGVPAPPPSPGFAPGGAAPVPTGYAPDPDPGPDAGAADAGAPEADAGAPEADAGAPEITNGVAPLPSDDPLPYQEDLCDDPEVVKRMPGIVVGASLAKSIGVKVGGCVTITSPTIGYAYSGGAVRPAVAKRFRVVAFFDAGFDQYDSKLVYTDLYEAQSFYDHGDTVTGVELRIENVDDAKKVGAEVDAALGKGRYDIMDWEELNHGLFTALALQQYLMSGVLALIIVVAAFSVIATLVMLVYEKKKEVSVLKAMGATDAAILRIFFYQGGLIGLAGTAAGLLLGFAVCKGLLVWGFPLDPKVYFISTLPVRVRAIEFLVTGGIAIVISVLATLFPSLYAAWLQPADGFRDR